MIKKGRPKPPTSMIYYGGRIGQHQIPQAICRALSPSTAWQSELSASLKTASLFLDNPKPMASDE